MSKDNKNVIQYLESIVAKIKKSTSGMYAIQLDETTDITNLAQLRIFVRDTYNGEFEDENSPTINKFLDEKEIEPENLLEALKVHLSS